MWRRNRRTARFGALGEVDDSPPPAKIEAIAGIRVPPSAGHIRAQLHQVLTKQMLYLRFSIEPTELEVVLADSPFGGRLSVATFPELLVASPRPGWFTPESARQFTAGQTPGKAILVDTSQSPLVVYLVARG